MMGLSNFYLEKMGFVQIPNGTKIEARFKSLNIYEIRGIVLNNKLPFLPGNIKQETDVLSVSIGDSVNAVCQALIGDVFTEDENKWRQNNKTNPPYLLVLTTVPESVSCNSGYWKHEDGKIFTYDCFTNAREALKKFEKERVATFVTSLSAGLSATGHPVAFIPIEREAFGITMDNKTLHDFRDIGTGELTVSTAITTDILTSGIEAAFSACLELHPNVGYFFDLATREKDVLKKFLYYYLVIEIHTHNEFKKIDYSLSFENLKVSERIGSSAVQFFVTYQEAKNLSQRFIWCLLLRWVEVSEKDFIQFREIKGFRDHIYHGEEVPERTLPVNQARQLALKILRRGNQLPESVFDVRCS